jgi:hypothetical protein
VHAFRRCAALPGWAEQAAWACYKGAECLCELSEFAAAVELCALGLARQPGSPELAWLAGWCCYQAGKLREAIHWEQIAVALGNVEGCKAGEGRISFRHLPARRALRRAEACLSQVGRPGSRGRSGTAVPTGPVDARRWQYAGKWTNATKWGLTSSVQLIPYWAE